MSCLFKYNNLQNSFINTIMILIQLNSKQLYNNTKIYFLAFILTLDNETIISYNMRYLHIYLGELNRRNETTIMLLKLNLLMKVLYINVVYNVLHTAMH